MTETTTEAPAAQDVKNNAEANGTGSGLAGLKLAQLKALASQLGIAGSSRMRKSDLVEAISAHQRGGAVADRDTKKAEKNGRAKEQKEQGDRPSRKKSEQDAGSSEATEAAAEQSSDHQQEQSDQDKGRGRNRRSRNDRSRNDDAQQGGENQGKSQQKKSEDHQDRQQGGGNEDSRDQSDQDSQGRDNDDDRGGNNRDDRNDRRNRRRNRNDRNRNRRDRNDRNRGPEFDDEQVTDEDQLIPIAGILDVLDNYAFVRTSGYLPGQNDVYVSLQQVKKNSLRKGDVVTGFIKAPNENQKPNKRQKFAALVKVEKVNGRPVEANTERVEFNKLTPLYPQDRLRLEGDPKNLAPRVIDLVAPIGKGQRGLIVSPPKAGKTMILQALAQAIKTNNPEVHLMMVLVDERPEEVTDMQRTVDGEVIASTFDRPADDHTTVAELAIERAKRLVELGKDVVVLLDSMTRLGRAYNTAAPASGRILSGGVDANALYPPKRFFGAARNIEHGGSLTILATALVETGSKMDEVIFEEFKGTGNMELRLSRRLADKRIFPAISVSESSTRREENLLSGDEVQIMWKLRRVLSGLEQEQGLDLLLKKIKETSSNAEFLLLTQKTTLGGNGDK
ncbi:transcription termination factor Rho [Nesterenkonia ebinurensis]|uniref:transcription termination factor Rho n=1 Tax=Nesterenkonia ebinurensis TaxID=2608252 RepID=UPI00123D2C97